MEEFSIDPQSWYYRNKMQESGLQPIWRATWPEGDQIEAQTVNFIGQLYFTAPNREAALLEFRRWALVRMQDVPCIVLEQIDETSVPRCWHPTPNATGRADLEVEYRLT